MTRVATKITAVLGVTLVLAATAAGPAEARRGGSFGSRGARTFQPVTPTRTLPQATAPVQRSMTAPPRQAQPGAPAAAAANQARPRGGLLGGLGGGLIGGLVAGGLLGMLMGHGWGGLGAGLGAALMQLALFGVVAWMLLALFRRFRSGTTPAAAGPGGYAREATGFGAPFGGSGPAEAPRAYAPPPPAEEDIGLTQSDRDSFERLLTGVQEAFGREDYAALRALTTPEIMSYLSEELSQNATHGRRNDVADVRLLQADVAEAWREGDADYATAAMRYASIDVMRDRQSGAVMEGDPDRPTETIELWTFVRRDGGEWKLSAIQEA